MSLQLILGGSGAGKSTYLYSSIIEESINNPDTDYIIIVPEQYTMATQKRVVELHPRKGILNIDVISFERLAYRVFEEVGASDYPVLDGFKITELARTGITGLARGAANLK